MAYPTFGFRLPNFLSSRLFGDRDRYGLVVQPQDPSWIAWEKSLLDFYTNMQQKSVGAFVNRAGYRIMGEVDLSHQRVLEIGPGRLPHMEFWKSRPAEYVLADIRQSMIDQSAQVLTQNGVSNRQVLLSAENSWQWPAEIGLFDSIVSFYSLEHIYPLEPYVDQLMTLLKPGGRLIGAIPCEGGLAWGLGRFLTSRRWLLKNTRINPDKVICWEHPNFAPKILQVLDSKMDKEYLNFWPLKVPLVDINLVAKFIYRKPEYAKQ